jgi:hypothetical protein
MKDCTLHITHKSDIKKKFKGKMKCNTFFYSFYAEKNRELSDGNLFCIRHPQIPMNNTTYKTNKKGNLSILK